MSERVEQPAPVANGEPAVWPAVIMDAELALSGKASDLVLADMAARDRVGRERYGVPIQPHNGRDALRDAYEEALDEVVYLKQAIIEGQRGISVYYLGRLDDVSMLRGLLLARDGR